MYRAWKVNTQNTSLYSVLFSQVQRTEAKATRASVLKREYLTRTRGQEKEAQLGCVNCLMSYFDCRIVSFSSAKQSEISSCLISLCSSLLRFLFIKVTE